MTPARDSKQTALSECGTWSHAVISSLGARARGGVGRAPAFSVARCQTWTQVSHPRCPSTEDFGNRTVTFRIDHTPLHRIAVQFEWAEPFGELQKKTENMSIFGACQFSPKKNVCLSTQLGACSHPTGRPTVPYWCTIDVRTPWARHGVPTGPPGPRRDPTDPWRTPGGTVGPRLIGASPVWAARSSYWRSQGYCRSERSGK